jgi:hypothetical protein
MVKKQKKIEEKRRPLPVNIQEKLFLEKLAKRRKGEPVKLRTSDAEQLKVYYTMMFVVLAIIISYATFIMTFGQQSTGGGF